MKRENKHIKDIDQLINEPLVDKYEPSVNFVDQVMARVEAEQSFPVRNRVLPMAFRVAAAVALVFFLTNAFVILSSSFNSSGTLSETEWMEIYESGSSTSWYDYIDNELLTDNN